MQNVMNAIAKTEQLRLQANALLDPKRKSSLGQFYTPAPICRYMASLFEDLNGDINLLDAGCGVGSLTAAFCDEAARRGEATGVAATCFDVEAMVIPFVEETFHYCKATLQPVPFQGQAVLDDYILSTAEGLTNRLFGKPAPVYSHVILNPPYKKITSGSAHRKALAMAGVDAVNLYAGFVGLALHQLQPGGEMVAIIPRSFCNGTYYQPFRKLLLTTSAIRHIHIFESRKDAFSEGGVLQENVILHLVKSAPQQEVTITSSPAADFSPSGDGRVVAAGMTSHKVAFEDVVKPQDSQCFLHIPTGSHDQDIAARMAQFEYRLTDLGIEVSTGPVVDFRLKEDLVQEYEPGSSVPLLYPSHFNGTLHWPQEGKKPNAIRLSTQTRPWLWENKGYFVVVRRLTSKEEKRRLVAYCYEGNLPEGWIGFDNKLNVFHLGKKGLDEWLAKGLCLFLNASLPEHYYRSLGGHTQVNAGDLRSFHYPAVEVLRQWGRSYRPEMPQAEIDALVEAEFAETLVTENF